MESIIKGLEILNTYNGRLKVSNDLIRLESFEIPRILKNDFEILEKLGWELITKRDNGNLIRASYNTEKNI